jgi:hypothetical protein
MAKITKRIYLVKSEIEGFNPMLVEALNRTQAVGYCAKNLFEASIPSQRELMEAAVAGAQIHQIGVNDEAA